MTREEHDKRHLELVDWSLDDLALHIIELEMNLKKAEDLLVRLNAAYESDPAELKDMAHEIRPLLLRRGLIAD